MTRNTFLRRALFGVAATASVGILAACGGDGMGGMDHGNQPAATASAGATFVEADVSFAQNMIAHHEQAVQMSTLAETQAKDPELKALAAQIKAAQAPEITTMTAWLNAWGQPIVPPGGHGGGHAMPGMVSEADMKALEAATGTDFDRLFARAMIAHHNGAIQMAQEEQVKGTNLEAKKLAATIEKDQSAEVTKLQAILDRL